MQEEHYDKREIENLVSENRRLKSEINTSYWAIPLLIFGFLGLFGAFSNKKSASNYDETSNYVLCLQHPEDFKPHKCRDFK